MRLNRSDRFRLGFASLACRCGFVFLVVAHDHPALGGLLNRLALEAERSLMWRLGGSCALPLGAIATVNGARIEMLAVVIAPDGSRIARAEVVSDTPEGAAALATKQLIAEGAEEILEALEDEALEDDAGEDRG